MELKAIFVISVLTVSLVTGQTSLKCDDIDTAACQLLQAKRPDLCSDAVLAKSTCARFCKLCPLECFHCDATVQDFHLCNTTQLCGDGEVCMRKELKSFIDGHHEYSMTCADKLICDGGDLVIPFGKRNVESRDISVTCCADDLCNYPTSTQTTSTSMPVCGKDIVFLVDETSNVAKNEQPAVIQTIMNVVKRLNIGETSNLVALYGFNDNIDPKFGFHQNTDKASLLTAIQLQNFNTRERLPDLHDAVRMLTHQILQPKGGDRTNYTDAVVIITDSLVAHNVHRGVHDKADLQKVSQDVIVVSVGASHTFVNNGPESLATDKNHIIHVSDMYTPANLVDSIVALLQKC